MNEKLTTSKALSILYNHEDLQGGHDDYWKAYRFVEKRLKALEIILKKGRYICVEYNEFNHKYYIYDNELYMNNEITKEEYDLLTELGL